MLARLTDPHWVFLWTDPNPARIIADVTARFPFSLATGRDRKRHQMVSYTDDSGEKTVVGYARWIVPDSVLSVEDKTGTFWPEAQVQAVSDEELQVFKKNFDAASDGGQVPGMKKDGMMEFRSRPLEEADEAITRGEEFLSKFFSFLSILRRYTLHIMLCSFSGDMPPPICGIAWLPRGRGRFSVNHQEHATCAVILWCMLRITFIS